MKNYQELEKRLKFTTSEMTVLEARKEWLQAYIRHAKLVEWESGPHSAECCTVDRQLKKLGLEAKAIRAELMKTSFDHLIDSAGPGVAAKDAIRDQYEMTKELINRIECLENDSKMYRERIIALINAVEALKCLPNTAHLNILFDRAEVKPLEWTNFIKEKMNEMAEA